MQKVIVFLTTAAVLCTINVHAEALKEQDIFGVWRDVKTGGLLKIYSCADKLCIKIAKVRKAGAKDVHNPDKALRSRPLLGVHIMSDGKKSGLAAWEGHLYNTRDGRTYTGSLKLVKKSELKLSGCVLGGLICASRVWQKVK